MWEFAAKAALAGVIVAMVATVAQRQPSFGALIASLPLISILGMIFLWYARPDAENMALHAEATFWYVLPSLPMFLLIPLLLRSGANFWLSLAIGCAVTISLYATMAYFGRKLGLPI